MLGSRLTQEERILLAPDACLALQAEPGSPPPHSAPAAQGRELVSSRSIMTCLSLCLTFQAVVWVTPRRRPSSMLEIPCLLWVRWYMARNQVRSGSLVDAKMVPAIGEVCRRQAVHWNRPRLLTRPCRRPRKPGR